VAIIKDEKITVENHHMKGYKILVVGQPISGISIPKATYISAVNLFSPMSLIELLQKHKIASTIKILGDFPIDANRNRFIEECLTNYADYLFFMDMDMTFPNDTLLRLFETISDDCPVVSGMYYLKRDPYSPVMGRYSGWDDLTLQYKKEFNDLGFVHSDGRFLAHFRPFTYFNLDKPFRADVIGMGCCLISTDIFRKMTPPYFRYTRDPRDGLGHKTMSEDMYFCAQLAKLNIPIWIDPRVQCGHLTQLEANYEIFRDYRDAQFKTTQEKDPVIFEQIKAKFIDVREEQSNGLRVEGECSTCGTGEADSGSEVTSLPQSIGTQP